MDSRQCAVSFRLSWSSMILHTPTFPVSVIHSPTRSICTITFTALETTCMWLVLAAVLLLMTNTIRWSGRASPSSRVMLIRPRLKRKWRAFPNQLPYASIEAIHRRSSCSRMLLQILPLRALPFQRKTALSRLLLEVRRSVIC